MICSYVKAQTLYVSVLTDSIAATEGSGVDLACAYNVDRQTPASCEKVTLSWTTIGNAGSLVNIWQVDTELNQNNAWGDYISKLTGSPGSLSHLNADGNVIRFTSIAEEDAGQYWCYVECWTREKWLRENSPLITVMVKSEYIIVSYPTSLA